MQAQVVLAEASQRAIEMVSSAVGDKEIPVAYLLGEQYIKAMQICLNQTMPKQWYCWPIL